jgi:hypothetical protein
MPQKSNGDAPQACLEIKNHIRLKVIEPCLLYICTSLAVLGSQLDRITCVAKQESYPLETNVDGFAISRLCDCLRCF